MFGFFKKKDVCIEWLIKVDKVYIDALRSNNASKLERYFSRRCLGRVVEIVNSNRDNLCGLERYRDVAYTLQSKTDRQLIYLKITIIFYYKKSFKSSDNMKLVEKCKKIRLIIALTNIIYKIGEFKIW